MASSYAPVSRFDFGRVVERTFSSIGRNFAVFAVLAALLSGLPAALTGGLIAVATASAGTAAAGQNTASSTNDALLGGATFAILYFVGAVASFILQAAIVHGTVADLNGRRASFSECFATGVRHAFWLFLLAVVVTIAEAAGYILFIAPGLMMLTAWIVAVPVQVVERTGVFGSMGRSAELTRGHRWAIFGLLLIFAIGSTVVGGAITAVGAGFAAGTAPVNSALVVQGLLHPIATAITSLIGAAGVASIYYELRSTREGIGPEQLAAVFD